jgi:hypothetical protein
MLAENNGIHWRKIFHALHAISQAADHSKKIEHGSRPTVSHGGEPMVWKQPSEQHDRDAEQYNRSAEK